MKNWKTQRFTIGTYLWRILEDSVSDPPASNRCVFQKTLMGPKLKIVLNAPNRCVFHSVEDLEDMEDKIQFAIQKSFGIIFLYAE